MDWSSVFALLQLVWTAASPELKVLAYAELQKLIAADAGKHPFLDAILTEAEKLVAPSTPA